MIILIQLIKKTIYFRNKAVQSSLELNGGKITERALKLNDEDALSLYNTLKINMCITSLDLR